MPRSLPTTMVVMLLAGCGAPSVPSIAPAPVATATPSAVAAEPPSKPLCRPEVRGQILGASSTADALQRFFERAIRGYPLDEWMTAFPPSRQSMPQVAQEIRRLHACPRVFEVESSVLDGDTFGHLEFDEPELGRLAARILSTTYHPKPILMLDDLERSFVGARGRRALVPFLARAPEWIPSGAAGCEHTHLALFRGTKENVLCAVSDDATRCFAFATHPSGRLHLEIVGYQFETNECAVGTNLVFGADLTPRIVPYRQYQFERNAPVQKLGGEPYRGTQSNKPIPRAWTELPSRFKEVDAASFPASAVADLMVEEANRDDLGGTAPSAITTPGNDLFCLRIDRSWRCAPGLPPYASPGRTEVRSASDETAVSIADASDSIDRGGFVHLFRVADATLVEVGSFPRGARSDYDQRFDLVEGDKVETLTQIVQGWRYVHEAPFCLRMTEVEMAREIHREIPNSGTPRRSTSRRETLQARYTPGPTTLPAMASAMDSPREGQPIVDLRGVWTLDGETWTRGTDCQPKAAPHP